MDMRRVGVGSPAPGREEAVLYQKQTTPFVDISYTSHYGCVANCTRFAPGPPIAPPTLFLPFPFRGAFPSAAAFSSDAVRLLLIFSFASSFFLFFSLSLASSSFSLASRIVSSRLCRTRQLESPCPAREIRSKTYRFLQLALNPPINPTGYLLDNPPQHVLVSIIDIRLLLLPLPCLRRLRRHDRVQRREGFGELFEGFGARARGLAFATTFVDTELVVGVGFAVRGGFAGVLGLAVLFSFGGDGGDWAHGCGCGGRAVESGWWGGVVRTCGGGRGEVKSC